MVFLLFNIIYIAIKFIFALLNKGHDFFSQHYLRNNKDVSNLKIKPKNLTLMNFNERFDFKE